MRLVDHQWTLETFLNIMITIAAQMKTVFAAQTSLPLVFPLNWLIGLLLQLTNVSPGSYDLHTQNPSIYCKWSPSPFISNLKTYTFSDFVKQEFFSSLHNSSINSELIWPTRCPQQRQQHQQITHAEARLRCLRSAPSSHLFVFSNKSALFSHRVVFSATRSAFPVGTYFHGNRWMRRFSWCRTD